MITVEAHSVSEQGGRSGSEQSARSVSEQLGVALAVMGYASTVLQAHSVCFGAVAHTRVPTGMSDQRHSHVYRC